MLFPTSEHAEFAILSPYPKRSQLNDSYPVSQHAVECIPLRACEEELPYVEAHYGLYVHPLSGVNRAVRNMYGQNLLIEMEAKLIFSCVRSDGGGRNQHSCTQSLLCMPANVDD